MFLSREEIEARECATLAPYAVCGAASRGRVYPEEEHAYRTAFQRDRDRIIHTTAFRRLDYKTQVFVYHEGDHYRNRLTHTVEVAQLGRSMARALGATPTPVAFPEAYTSLQTGVVDAAEGDPTALFTAKWFEPAKFITETEHIWHVRYMVMNAGVFDRLTGPQKDAILSSARDAQTFQIGLHREANKEALAKMQAGGATIIPIEDRSPFINALATFNREYAEKNGKEALVLLEKAGAVK